MNKTAQTEFHREYLIEGLPEPLTPASSHLQIFDNYIENTRIRLRKIRDPYTPSWTRVLQQRFSIEENDLSVTKSAEIYLNDNEYPLFSRFEGREIRKNRYFHDFGLVSMVFDVYLGRLWGLNIAKIEFETQEELEKFSTPAFAVFEVTNNPFFRGETLVEKMFSDVKDEVARISLTTPAVSEPADE